MAIYSIFSGVVNIIHLCLWLFFNLVMRFYNIHNLFLFTFPTFYPNKNISKDEVNRINIKKVMSIFVFLIFGARFLRFVDFALNLTFKMYLLLYFSRYWSQIWCVYKFLHALQPSDLRFSFYAIFYELYTILWIFGNFLKHDFWNSEKNIEN